MPKKTAAFNDAPFAEARIVRACVHGDRLAQSRLYEMFSGKMLQVCLRYARDRQEAEDIMLEGFYRVFKYIGQFQFKGSLEGWIRKVMVNAALQKYYPLRVDVSEMSTGIDTCCSEPGPHAMVDYRYLLGLVQQLPTTYRLVFNLYVFEGYKHREIAVMLGVTEGTSKSNLADARIKLKKAIVKKHWVMP